MKKQRLPDGTWTTDADLFTAEWDKLRKPFEAIGFRVVGFDPGLLLCDKHTWGNSFDLPLWAAKRIIEAMGMDETESNSIGQLHTFLNAAAGEGIVLDGVDAANLYVALFKERYVSEIS